MFERARASAMARDQPRRAAEALALGVVLVAAAAVVLADRLEPRVEIVGVQDGQGVVGRRRCRRSGQSGDGTQKSGQHGGISLVDRRRWCVRTRALSKPRGRRRARPRSRLIPPAAGGASPRHADLQDLPRRGMGGAAGRRAKPLARRSIWPMASSISRPPPRRAETAAKHFAGAEGLMLLALEAEALGAALRWEPVARRRALPASLRAAAPGGCALGQAAAAGRRPATVFPEDLT